MPSLLEEYLEEIQVLSNAKQIGNDALEAITTQRPYSPR
jgi:hypothetical protein